MDNLCETIFWGHAMTCYESLSLQVSIFVGVAMLILASASAFIAWYYPSEFRKKKNIKERAYKILLSFCTIHHMMDERSSSKKPLDYRSLKVNLDDDDKLVCDLLSNSKWLCLKNIRPSRDENEFAGFEFKATEHFRSKYFEISNKYSDFKKREKQFRKLFCDLESIEV
jgi:hypothetical protein